MAKQGRRGALRRRLQRAKEAAEAEAAAAAAAERDAALARSAATIIKSTCRMHHAKKGRRLALWAALVVQKRWRGKRARIQANAARSDIASRKSSAADILSASERGRIARLRHREALAAASLLQAHVRGGFGRAVVAAKAKAAVEQAHLEAENAAIARAAQEAIERAALTCIDQPIWLERAHGAGDGESVDQRLVRALKTPLQRHDASAILRQASQRRRPQRHPPLPPEVREVFPATHRPAPHHDRAPVLAHSRSAPILKWQEQALHPQNRQPPPPPRLPPPAPLDRKYTRGVQRTLNAIDGTRTPLRERASLMPGYLLLGSDARRRKLDSLLRASNPTLYNTPNAPSLGAGTSLYHVVESMGLHPSSSVRRGVLHLRAEAEMASRAHSQAQREEQVPLVRYVLGR